MAASIISLFHGEINDRSLLLSLNKMTQYFKKWTTLGGVLKKYIFFHKNVML